MKETNVSKDFQNFLVDFTEGNKNLNFKVAGFLIVDFKSE